MTTGRSAPLSYGQELFYLLDRSTPGLIAYNVPRAFRLRGTLREDALRQAFDAFIGRHEVLRSVYAMEGDHPVQVVLADASVPFEVVDLSGLDSATREPELARALAERAAWHFDLASDVMMRATLFSLAPDEHVLFFLTHHIVSDGWSKSITFRELDALYAAFAASGMPALAPLPEQFADHARRERAVVEGAEQVEHLAYWREKLAGPRAVLELPTDRLRPVGHTFEGDVRETVLPSSLVNGMRKLGQDQGASLYMVLLAAYQTLLHRYSGQDDIITGSPTAGRDAEETHDLIGYFAGALVLRNSFAGNPTFAELLERVANTCLDAYEHQDIPFEKLVAELQQGEQLTHAPLFQCVLTMEDTIPAAFQLAGMAVEGMDVGVSTTKFDLTLLFSEHPDGLRLKLAFRTALFDGDRIERMLGHLRTLLEAAVADPSIKVDELPLLTAVERQQIAAWSGTAVDEGPPTTFVELFERHAARTPDRVAVVGDDASLTFAQLNARANRIANALVASGMGPGAAVGLCFDRTAEMIAAMIGVAKSGAAYVPLLPDVPAPRLAVQMKESGVTLTVTRSGHRALLPEQADMLLLDVDEAALAQFPAENPGLRATPDDIAYVLFTSGSTGVPKGVAVTHANIAHYTRAIARRIDLDLSGAGTPWSFASVSTLGADLGHTSVFGALCSGGTLHVMSSAVASDATLFARYMQANPMDLLKITPNHMRALLANASSDIVPSRWIILGGEGFPWDLARELRRAGKARVLNHYGPTETTVGVLTFEVTSDTPVASLPIVPLGQPLVNNRLYVLDEHRQLVPAGVPGELYVGGMGVARGYLGRDDLTRERFLADTFSGEPNARMYRSGDRVRWHPTGVIEFLGRADDQVKVRGFRVELGEIEQALRAHPGVESCAVLLRDDNAGASRLVAYVVPKQAGYAVAHADRATPENVINRLAAQLPDYMVPGAVVMLERLPLTPNGKIDKAKLPLPDGPGPDDAAIVEPRTDTERAVAQIWCEVLKRERIGITQSFLDLGGHSLLAIRVLGRISKQLGVRLALRALFDTPTVEQIASIIDAERTQKDADAAMKAALAEVENLSDDEVAQLLAADAPASKPK